MSVADDSEADLTGDFDWEWIYAAEGISDLETCEDVDFLAESPRNDSIRASKRIIGARHGRFEAYVGEAFILKNDGKDTWLAILVECIEEEVEGEKQVKFMWFSFPKEIRNSSKRRTDYLQNEVYITSNMDENSLDTIIGRAKIMSPGTFQTAYPSGKVSAKNRDAGRIFVCRRGCNIRTATYTQEFTWEDIYQNVNDLSNIRDIVDRETRTTRKRKVEHDSLQHDTVYDDHDETVEDENLITPRKKRKLDVMRTPTPKRKGDTPRKLVTPSKSRIISKRRLEFTPLGTRTIAYEEYQSPLQRIRAKLHVSAVPSALPCREQEFNQVYSYLESAVTAGTGSCIYISGTPGTGKTATVREVVASLSASVEAEELDDFIFVEINGMKVTDPHQSYTILWEALTGDRVSPANALKFLEREFSHPSPRRVPCVVLMDELDQLVTKTQSVMYNFFNWPGLQHSRLIVLAVANTMDLPERTLSNKISSRLGLTRITFPGYTHDQLIKIIESRLSGIPGQLVEPDAVQFASRKVAQVSGDARRALDICRRAVEIAELEAAENAKSNNSLDENLENIPPTPTSKSQAMHFSSKQSRKPAATAPLPPPGSSHHSSTSTGRVTIATVQRAIREATTNPLQRYLRSLPLASKVFLAAMLSRARRTGVAECVVGEIIDEATNLAKITTLHGSCRFLLLNDDDGYGTQEDVLDFDRSLAAIDTPSRGRRPTKKSTVPAKAPRLRALGAAGVELMDAGVLLMELVGIGSGRRHGERTARVRLNVGEDEIRMALKGDEDVASFGIAAG